MYRCARHLCPCDAMDGSPTSYCCPSCRGGVPCRVRKHEAEPFEWCNACFAAPVVRPSTTTSTMTCHRQGHLCPDPSTSCCADCLARQMSVGGAQQPWHQQSGEAVDGGRMHAPHPQRRLGPQGYDRYALHGRSATSVVQPQPRHDHVVSAQHLQERAAPQMFPSPHRDPQRSAAHVRPSMVQHPNLLGYDAVGQAHCVPFNPCRRSGCHNPVEPSQDYCSLECYEGPQSEDSHGSGAAPCARRNCPCDAYDGRPGSFCCRSCRDGTKCNAPAHRRAVAVGAPPAAPAAAAVRCARDGCPCDAHDGREGSYCGRTCNGGLRCALRCHTFQPGRARAAERCARVGCPCDAFRGIAGNHCSKTCRDGGAPCAFGRHKHVPARLPDNVMPTAVADALLPMDSRFQQRSTHFVKTWCAAKGRVPKVVKIFAITAPVSVQQRHLSAKQQMQNRNQSPNERTLFHGLRVAPSCTLFARSTFCDDASCAVCGITQNGFDPTRIGSGVLAQQMKPGPGFKRFGNGFYFAYNSSKSHDYSSPHPFECDGKTLYCMIICVVAMGKAYKVQATNTTMTCPDGYDSVVGEVGTDLNYPEAVVYAADRAVPTYAVFYATP